MTANTNTIRTTITRMIHALRESCKSPISPERGDVAAATERFPAAAAERFCVPLHAKPAPVLVTSTPTGSFTVIDCAFTNTRT